MHQTPIPALRTETTPDPSLSSVRGDKTLRFAAETPELREARLVENGWTGRRGLKGVQGDDSHLRSLHPKRRLKA